MYVEVKPILEFARKPIVDSLDIAIEERRDLGLSVPTNFNLNIGFHQTPGTFASAVSSTNKNPSLNISLLNIIRGFAFKTKKKALESDVKNLINYFDIARDFLGGFGESRVALFLDDPEKQFYRFEHEIHSSSSLQSLKRMMDKRGVPYANYKDYLFNNIESTQSLLIKVIDSGSDFIKSYSYNVLRHELDHVDFYENVALHDTFLRQGLEFGGALINAHSNTNPLTQSKYLKMLPDKLRSVSKVNSFMEARAYFFNFVPLGEWRSADFDSISSKIENHYCNNYIKKSFQGQLLSYAINAYWIVNKMDETTSNYLHQKIANKTGSIDSERYGQIDESKVDKNLAKQILEHDLPHWENIFIEDAKQVIGVLNQVYSKDTSIFPKANSAKTVDQYVQILNQELQNL